jgi:phosphatidylinositol alpha 1,6-mannosyltransferase
MIPATHLRLGIQITNQWDEEQRSMASVAAFLDGSTLPDRYLPLRLMTHGFPQSGPYIFSLLASLIHKRLDPRTFGRRLGIVTHFLADYACAYHSKPSLKNRIFGHRAYERNLDSFPLQLTDVSPVPIRSLASLWNDLETYVARRHNDKVENNPQQDINDALGMIQSVSNLVFAAALANQRVQSPLRVAFFSDTFYPHVNGVSNTLRRASLYLAKTNIDHLLVVPSYAKPAIEHEQGVTLCRTRSVVFPFYKGAMMAFPSRRQITAVMNLLRPNLIHTMTEFNLGSCGARYAKKHRIPLITNYSTHYHMGVAHYGIGMIGEPLKRYLDWFHHQADLTSCPSQDTKRYLRSRGIDPVFVFGRGVDANLFAPEHRSLALRKEWDAETKTVFLYVGRVSGEKDLPVLIEAYERFSKEDRNETKLVIVGDGPERMTLEPAHPEILFTGTLSGKDLSKAYASADIFVFPSPSETLGNVVLEAMASALPVVCVGSGGVLDVVRDHANGFLVPPQDVAAFHDAMHLLFRNRVLRSRLGQAGRKDALRKSWDDVFDRLIDRYLTLQYEKEVFAEPLEQSCPLVPDRIGSFKSV